MNERHKEALRLRESGMTYKEIGAKLSVSANRARQIVENAKSEIKNELENPTPEWVIGLDSKTIRRITFTGCSKDELIKLLQERTSGHLVVPVNRSVNPSAYCDQVTFGTKTADKIAAFFGVKAKRRAPIMSPEYALKMLVESVDAAIQSGDWKVDPGSDHITWIEHARTVMKRRRQ